MPLYKFNSHPAPGYHADGSLVIQDTRSPISLKTKSPRKIITSDFCGGGGYGSGSGAGSGGIGGF